MMNNDPHGGPIDQALVSGIDGRASSGSSLELAQDPQAVLTVDEVSVLLRVDRKSIYAAVARGEVPGALRVGRLIRFSRDVVLRWIREGQAPTRTRRSR